MVKEIEEIGNIGGILVPELSPIKITKFGDQGTEFISDCGMLLCMLDMVGPEEMYMAIKALPGNNSLGTWQLTSNGQIINACGVHVIHDFNCLSFWT